MAQSAEPPPRKAQATVPAFSVDLLIGKGHHTRQAGRTYFQTSAKGYGGFTISGRLFGPGRVRPVVQVGYFGKPTGDEVALCSPDPIGGCRVRFQLPNTQIGAGLAGAAGRKLVVTALGGWALVNPRAMGVDAAQTKAPYAGGTVAWQLGQHTSVIGDMRHFFWRLDEQPYWARAMSFGLRIQ
ncbi:MAG TPA: hypothetical protein VGE27_06460 [Gemmatimonas sp.]|uniref:hypothetical protein n=1 Tax=Gemmatimonas sp. TaxID=1962908 RepID=UPI002EDAED07